MIPPEATIIVATIGLTPDQAAQVARAFDLIEIATFKDCIHRAKAQSALDEIEDRRERRRERNSRYYEKIRRIKTPRASNVVLMASENVLCSSRARVLYGAEEEYIPPVDTSVSTAPKGADRARRLPENWSPSEDHLREGDRIGLSRSQVGDIAEEFRNYWLSEGGARARKIDWGRAFLNRLRDQAPRILSKNHARAGPRPLNGRERDAEFFRRMLRSEDEPGIDGGPQIGTTLDLGAEEFSRSDGAASQRG